MRPEAPPTTDSHLPDDHQRWIGKVEVSRDPDYVCPGCGKGYDSQAPLSDLHDPTCDKCGGNLIENEAIPTPDVYSDETGEDLV